MSPEEIKKGLECHSKDENSCDNCAFWGEGCSLKLCKDALELINRQQKKIKELDEKNVIKKGLIDRQQAEIEKLKAENDSLRGFNDSIVKRMQYLLQSNTIHQFDEIDPHTHQYKKDVLKFDEEIKRYKEAFEKQVPKKPDYWGDGYADGVLCYDYAKCPVCERDFEEGINDWGCKYCADCGQALDWSTEE